MHGSQTGLGKSEEVIIKPECLLRAAALAVREREEHIHQAEPIDAQRLELGAL